MEHTEKRPFKLNMKRTMLIGFAFFGILLLWQVYDSWCPTLLSELFAKATFGEAFTSLDLTDNASIAVREGMIKEVQYIVGVVMAFDNLAALIMLPIFGNLSDKTHTKIGKRMPYILVGTFVCAVAFPFIPILFHFNNLVGVILMMAIVVIFAMMYRNPAVALMPDITPKPLRSKANGIINIMGYIGGLFATIVGIVFVLSNYLGTKTEINDAGEKVWAPKVLGSYGNVWTLFLPFLIASILMVISAVVLFITVKENKIADEMKDEMARGELESETVDAVKEDQPMTEANRTMLILILAAEFFWFMADNGIATFMGNYTIYYLGASSSSNMVNTIMGGVGSVIGFAIGGIIASKIGRKWTLSGGLGITFVAYVIWMILTFVTKPDGSFPWWIFAVWFIKGFGMSLVHVNSFPMVVELCPNSQIGKFTGFYYAASMAAQTVTPIVLGLLLRIPSFPWSFLPLYALGCTLVAAIIFLFVKNVKSNKTGFKSGLEGIGQDD